MSGVTYTVATASNPGAIGIVQLSGCGVPGIIEKLTGRTPPGLRSFVADLAGIDEGIVALLREDWAQLMPHGGPRVIQRLTEKLRELGASPADHPPAGLIYPEASCDMEADMLATLARAASPAAIDILLDQPRVWREWIVARVPRGGNFNTPGQPVAPKNQLLAPDPRRHLIDPPTVVLVGRANVGKSTLSNLVLGRVASITADLPGTTRDWVAGLAELSTPIGELAVRWIDTPGLRETNDPIERRAIELARRVIENADVLVAVRDPQIHWPDLPGARQADIRLVNKSDLPGVEAIESLRVSALTGHGLDELGEAVAGALGLGSEQSRERKRPVGGDRRRASESPDPGVTVADARGSDRPSIEAHRGDDPLWSRPWVFCPELRGLVDTEDWAGLLRYCPMA